MGYSAESYETYLAPTLFAPWASYLVRAAQAQPGERVLDVACGTGIVARRIAPRVESQGKVIGLDRDPNMLRVARLAANVRGWRLTGVSARLSASLFPRATLT